VVREHLRSWAMQTFNRANTTSYSTLIEIVSVFYHFRGMVGYSSKVADFNPPHLLLAPS